MDRMSFENLTGTQVGKTKLREIFKGFQVDEILLEYDFPRIFSAVSREGEHWLFKWCDSAERNDKDMKSWDTWLAFKISEPRLKSVKEGTTSLREAISLAEEELYLYTCIEPFLPIQAKVTEYEMIPKEYLPRNDVSLKDGRVMDIARREPQQLGIRIHMLIEGYTPMSYVRLSDTFQQFISSAAHNVAQETLLPSYGPKDWSVLNVTSTSSGSYNIECVSSDPKKSRFLSDACDSLETMISGQKNVEAIRKEMGDDAFQLAAHLLRLISRFDVSVSLKWITDEKPNGYLALDKRRADRVLDAIAVRERPEVEEIEVKRAILEEEKPLAQTRKVIIEMNEGQPEPLTSVTLVLSEEEANPLRKDIVSRGGMQSLLRELQKKLEKDNTITFTPIEIERILKYASKYGSGGFQGRLIGVARALRRVGIGLTEI